MEICISPWQLYTRVEVRWKCIHMESEIQILGSITLLIFFQGDFEGVEGNSALSAFSHECEKEFIQNAKLLIIYHCPMIPGVVSSIWPLQYNSYGQTWYIVTAFDKEWLNCMFLIQAYLPVLWFFSSVRPKAGRKLVCSEYVFICLVCAYRNTTMSSGCYTIVPSLR